MLIVFRPSYYGQRRTDFSKSDIYKTMNGVFWLIPAGPTQNQEVTTSKIVTFFFGASLVPGFG